MEKEFDLTTKVINEILNKKKFINRYHSKEKWKKANQSIKTFYFSDRKVDSTSKIGSGCSIELVKNAILDIFSNIKCNPDKNNYYKQCHKDTYTTIDRNTPDASMINKKAIKEMINAYNNNRIFTSIKIKEKAFKQTIKPLNHLNNRNPLIEVDITINEDHFDYANILEEFSTQLYVSLKVFDDNNETNLISQSKNLFHFGILHPRANKLRQFILERNENEYTREEFLQYHLNITSRIIKHISKIYNIILLVKIPRKYWAHQEKLEKILEQYNEKDETPIFIVFVKLDILISDENGESFNVNKSKEHIHALYKDLIEKSQRIREKSIDYYDYLLKGDKGVGKTAFINYFNSSYICKLDKNKICTVKVSLTHPELLETSEDILQLLSYNFYRIINKHFFNNKDKVTYKNSITFENYKSFLNEKKYEYNLNDLDIKFYCKTVMSYESFFNKSIIRDAHLKVTESMIKFLLEKCNIVVFIAIDGFDALYHSSEYGEKLQGWKKQFDQLQRMKLPIIKMLIVRNETINTLTSLNNNLTSKQVLRVEAVDISILLRKRILYLSNIDKNYYKKTNNIFFQNNEWITIHLLVEYMLENENLSINKVCILFNNNYRKFLTFYTLILTKIVNVISRIYSLTNTTPTNIIKEKLKSLVPVVSKIDYEEHFISGEYNVANLTNFKTNFKNISYRLIDDIILGNYTFHFSPYKFKKKNGVVITNLREDFKKDIAFLPNLFTYPRNIIKDNHYNFILIKLLIIKSLEKKGSAKTINNISVDVFQYFTANNCVNGIKLEEILDLVEVIIEEFVFYSFVDKNFNHTLNDNLIKLLDSGREMLGLIDNMHYFQYCIDSIIFPIGNLFGNNNGKQRHGDNTSLFIQYKLEDRNLKYTYDKTFARLYNAILLSKILSHRIGSNIFNFEKVNKELIEAAMTIHNNTRKNINESKDFKENIIDRFRSLQNI